MHFAPYVICGLAAVLAVDYVPPATKHLGVLPALWSSQQSVTPANRATKSDRAAPARAARAPLQISTVEVVGVHDAAIVYRDRDGRELFRTDPMSNVTIVTKGLLLPEVTVRQGAGSPVKPVVREVPAEPKPPTPQRIKVPLGCDPAFSPVAQPSMAHHTGRCVVEIATPTQFAQLTR